jgi:hypothetical protein
MCTSPKKCFLSSPVVKPRLRLGQKTSNSDEKDALFGLDTQITILIVSKIKIQKLVSFLSFPPKLLTTTKMQDKSVRLLTFLPSN